MGEPGKAVVDESLYRGAEEMRRGLIAGSYDPVTLGHVDLIERAASLFDELIILVGENMSKKGLFTVEERMELLQAALCGIPGIIIDSYDGLTVNYAREHKVDALVRGLRSAGDFSFELEIALNNRMLAPEIESVFLPASPEFMIVRSSQIKELAAFGADFSKLVPAPVADALRMKFQPKRDS